MMDGLRDFIARFTAPRSEEALATSDFRVAAAALLVHVADADGVMTATERARLLNLLETRFSIDTHEAARLLRAAEKSENEAVDLSRFTSVLKRRLDATGRARMIEMMWEMAYADGTVHEFEDNIVWRVAEMIGVEAYERVMLRLQVAERLGWPGEEDAGAVRPPDIRPAKGS